MTDEKVSQNWIGLSMEFCLALVAPLLFFGTVLTIFLKLGEIATLPGLQGQGWVVPAMVFIMIFLAFAGTAAAVHAYDDFQIRSKRWGFFQD